MWIDARIAVHFVEAIPEPGQSDRALILSPDTSPGSPERQGWATVLQLPESGVPPQAAAGHPSGCPCCRPRSVQAAGLTRLFQARARGEVGFFHGVVVHLPLPEAMRLREALVSDPFVSACFVEAG